MSEVNYVLGGGISAAAFCYFGREYHNIIFERESQLNGRIKSLLIGENAIEIGAQFFCQEDRAIYNTIKKLKFENKLIRANIHNFSILHKNYLIKFMEDKSENLSDEENKELQRFRYFLKKKFPEIFLNPPIEIYSAYFDEWYKEYIGENTVWFISSLVKSITFSEPEDLSAFYGLIVCSTFFETCYSIKGGLELLNVELLSIARPKIMKKKRITNLQIKNNKILELEINHEETIKIDKKDRVISTIPAGELSKLLPKCELKKQLNKVEYKGCGVVYLKVNKDVLNEGSGILTTEPNGISAAIDESNFLGIHSLRGNLVFLKPYKFGKKEVFENALEEIKIMFPGIEKNIERVEYFKWDYGLPVASRNFFDIQDKLINQNIENLYLCGDYMGLPSLDACFERARDIANEIKN